MNISITHDFTVQNSSPVLPRGEGEYIVFKTSQEVYGVSRVTYNDVPPSSDTVNLPDMWTYAPEKSTLENGRAKPHFTLMTPEICHWLFRLNLEKLGIVFESDQAYQAWYKIQDKGSKLFRDWKRLMKGDRSHTNRYGSDTCFDPITNSKPEAEYMRFFDVLTGRAIAKVKKKRQKADGGYIFGFSCINASKGNFSQYKLKEHWYLLDEPLQTGRKLIGYDDRDRKIWDESVCAPYGIFEPVQPVMPIMAPYDDIVWIDDQFARLLDPNEPNPPKYKLHY